MLPALYSRLVTLITVSGLLFSVLSHAVSAEEVPALDNNNTETTPAPTPDNGIAAAIDSEMGGAASQTARQRLSAIREHYETHGFLPIWTEDGTPTQKAHQVVEAIGRAAEHGLRRADYGVDALSERVSQTLFVDPAGFEVELSVALVAYAQHLNAGRVDPATVTSENVIYPDRVSANEILNGARKTEYIIPYLRLLAPRTPRYDRLRNAMRDYRRIAATGGWPVIPEGEVIKPGMTDTRVDILRKRLVVTGEYAPEGTPQDTGLYEGPIVEAVKLFQERHGLEIDGVIGPNTLKEINLSVEDRIAIMEYNLERRRWMQNDYGQHYIFANLADQVVKVVKNGKTIYAEIIQVGLPYHRTPVFTDTMEYIEFNPYWNVPYSIATRELLPKLKQNPHAYTSQGYEVLRGGQVINASAVPWHAYSRSNFPVRIRQRPGDRNALGRVKFMFPNKHNVYIHDTPSKSKFNNASRFFSHGCLRLKNPFRFAEILLGEQGWSRARIDQVVNSRKRTVVKLDKQLPVHVAYLTAWVNKDGSIHFRRDVYGRDAIMAKTLNRIRSGQ